MFRTLSLVIVVCAPFLGCAAPKHSQRGLPDPLMETRTPDRQRYVRPAPAPQPSPKVERPRPRQSLAGATVVVDPGHGGRDPGAHGLCQVPEKTVNLAVSRRLVALLKERGANVVTTRTGDQFLSLDERAAIAERKHANLFVSIHADAARRAGARGATVYIARGASRQSRQAAQAIVSALEREGIECLGVRPAGFRVLLGHSRPAVLIECGYLTNSAEARLLASAGYQQRLAQAICEGITAGVSKQGGTMSAR